MGVRGEVVIRVDRLINLMKPWESKKTNYKR